MSEILTPTQTCGEGLTQKNVEAGSTALLSELKRAACTLKQVVRCYITDANLPGSSVHGTLSRQEYWSGLPFPASGDLPDPGIEPVSLVSPALAGGFSTTASPGTQFVSILLMLTLIT